MFVVPQVSPCKFCHMAYVTFLYRPLSHVCERSLGLHDAAGSTGCRMRLARGQEGPITQFNHAGPDIAILSWNGYEFLLVRIIQFGFNRGVTDHPPVSSTYARLIPRKVRSCL